MNKYIFGRLLLVLSLLCGACSDDFLKPDPLSFYTPENTFIDEDGLDAGLVACLRNARHEFYGDACPIITEHIFSDVAVEGTTDKTGPAMDLPAQILPDAQLNSADYNRIGWYWTEGYKRIKYANSVISNIDIPEWTDEADRNNILGKAYFHRDRVYYRLTQQFGDVPFILNEVTEPKLDYYSCTRKSILQKCKKDLEFAAKWVKTEADGTAIGDVNKAAVNHLLTKVNLALCDFDDAIASATAVIDDGYHYLMTERFGTDKNDGIHDVIWDLHQEENLALSENRERIYLFVGSEDMTDDAASEKSQVMRNTVPFFSGTGKIKTPSGNSGMANTTGVEYDLLSEYGRGIGRCRPTPYYEYDIWTDKNDMRHTYPNWMTMEDLVYNSQNLKKNGDPYYGKHLQLYDDNGNILCTDTIRYWFDWPYYKLYIPDPTATLPVGGYGDTYCYRLAETYLLRAEAYFWKGELAKAAQDINAVRSRAGAEPIDASDVNIGTILDERARELYYEEPRKTELTRIAYILAETGEPCYNGKTYSTTNFPTDNFWYDRVTEKNIFYRDNVVSPHYTYRAAEWIVLWPVPASAIEANSLGHINQNEGYPGAEDNVTPYVWKDTGDGEGEVVPQE